MSTWGTRRIIDLLRGLTRVYHRRKYGALARQMGRPGISPDGRRGFIIIQIDGLAYDHLLVAMEAGHLPYLNRMVSEGRLALTPWNSGLPSTTPAVQAAIMFGNREDVPGFRWYEKERGLAVVTKRPDQVQALQARLKENRVGILIGGSSYVNMFDGDADLALFTLSAFHPQRFFESVRGAGLLLLFLFSPLRLLQVLRRTVAGYLRALGWRLTALLRRSVFKPYDLLSPLMATAINTLFTEVQTFGVILDIYRCVPSIYTNYNTYDEVAHQVGPTHRAAFAALRDIDRHIRQIDRTRQRHRDREYDLYILSDHGNTPSVPLSWEIGQSLGHFIAAQLGEKTSLDEVFGRPGYALAKARYLVDEMRGLEQQVPPTVRRVLCALRHYVDRRVPTDPEAEGYDLERREDVVVRVSGPLAHVYFNVAPRRLDLIEVGFLYPHLLDRLMQTDAIGLVVGRVGERTMALGPGGAARSSPGGRRRSPPPIPSLPTGSRSGWPGRSTGWSGSPTLATSS
ncbi:MAG TPA: hypothetical protein EYP77_05415 [Anaerolineae bacterium]|nr:hypothetical protein [Anaerolineae bacterium]